VSQHFAEVPFFVMPSALANTLRFGERALYPFHTGRYTKILAGNATRREQDLLPLITSELNRFFGILGFLVPAQVSESTWSIPPNQVALPLWGYQKISIQHDLAAFIMEKLFALLRL
jgi:hypothetical protein